MNHKKIQNIYDHPDFFNGYYKLRKNDQGFNALLEQPALISLLPEIKNKSVLDIGCGFGNFCRFAVQMGARFVLGIDPSKNMLDEAKTLTENKQIIYQQLAIESAEFSQQQFDIIVSSLAFHYVENYPAIIAKIADWLTPQGELIFSVEHPICTAHPSAHLIKDENHQECHPIYNYRDEKSFSQTWFVEGVIKYHRTVATYINILIEHGFVIKKILEPMSSAELIEKRPDFSVHGIRPPLLLIKSALNRKK